MYLHSREGSFERLAAARRADCALNPLKLLESGLSPPGSVSFRRCAVAQNHLTSIWR